MPQGHAHHAVAKVQKLLARLVQRVVHSDAVGLVQAHAQAPRLQLHVHQLPKHHAAVAARGRQYGAVARPRDIRHATHAGGGLGVRPAGAVAEQQRIEGAHCEELATRGPGHRGDSRFQRRARVQEPPEGVPHLVAAVLAAAHHQPAHRVPVHRQHHPLARAPRRAQPAAVAVAAAHGRRAAAQRLHRELPPRGVQQRVAIGAPRERKHGVGSAGERAPEHPRAAPHLHLAVLAAGGQRAAVRVPAQRGHGAAMRVVRTALGSPAARGQQAQPAVGGAHGDEVAVRAGHAGQPGGRRLQGRQPPRALAAPVPLVKRLIVRRAQQLAGARPAHGGAVLAVHAAGAAAAAQLEAHAGCRLARGWLGGKRRGLRRGGPRGRPLLP
mmetsp:Transcript_18189/g.46593  ORF Transcript_18189/g.46593 Transcript_18189/m.46593 type:complete len:382 (-) Transcript_18189:237-1382(-)